MNETTHRIYFRSTNFSNFSFLFVFYLLSYFLPFLFIIFPLEIASIIEDHTMKGFTIRDETSSWVLERFIRFDRSYRRTKLILEISFACSDIQATPNCKDVKEKLP